MAWGRMARSLEHDTDFLQASLLFVVRVFAAGGTPPAQQRLLAADLAEAAAGAASNGNTYAKP